MSSSGDGGCTLAAWRIATLAVVLLAAAAAPIAAQTRDSEEICDVDADYFLAMENYEEAIRAHLQLIKKNPHGGLAHYHLGFAYGMIGRHDRENEEYREALSLGRSEWSLLLNLGLSYFDQAQYSRAGEILKLAVLAAPDRPETHYNLALAYERNAMPAAAEQELLVSLVLDPAQPEARNMLALVHEEQGDRLRARQEWTELVRAYPDFEPAHQNLAILDTLNPACATPTTPHRDPGRADATRPEQVILTESGKDKDSASSPPCAANPDGKRR